MAQYTPAQLDELRELGTGILDTIRRVLREEPADPQEFLRRLNRLMEGYGMGGFAFAIRSWLDTVIEAFPNVERGRIHGIAFTNEAGTGFDDPTDMAPEYQWAANCLVARMGDDQVTLYQLIDSVPPDRANVFLLRAVAMVAGLLNDKESGGGPGFLHTGDVLLVKMTNA